MKLRFLGQAYFSTNDRVETVPSDNTARFLGQNYILRRPVLVAKSQPSLLKYRGISYSV